MSSAHKGLAIYLSTLSLILLGAGCLGTTATLPVSQPTTSTPPTAQTWQTLAGNVTSSRADAERAVFAFSDASSSFSLILYRFSPERYQIRLSADTQPHTVSAWSERLVQPALIANGVYFNDDYSPSGLLKIDGERVGEHRFDLDKSGALTIASGTARVLDTARETVNFAEAASAAQSFPLLISEGRAAVTRPGEQRARRTLVGQDEQGRFYIGIVAEPDATLYKLSQALTTIGVAWTNVLNLDGGPSSGLAAALDSHYELVNSQTGVPNVIYVTEK